MWGKMKRYHGSLPGYVSNHLPCAGTGFSPDFGHPGVALRRLGSSGSCGAGYARGEAPLGLREIDDGTIGIEDVPSTLFNVGIYQ
jgi:hypothetical protein